MPKHPDNQAFIEYFKRERQTLIVARDEMNMLIDTAEKWIEHMGLLHQAPSDAPWSTLPALEVAPPGNGPHKPQQGKKTSVSKSKKSRGEWRPIIEGLLSEGGMRVRALSEALQLYDRAGKTRFSAALNYGLRQGWLRRNDAGIYSLTGKARK